MEDSKQKSEEPKRNSEESKKKPISVHSLESIPKLDRMRQWQTFSLAIIIIFSYVVFFAWIIAISPETVDSQGTKIRNYDGMTTLTGTFGIIAAAVVGYYFGQRNLDRAANIAENATEMAKEAKDDVEVKKIDLNNEKRDYVNEVDIGVPLYDKAYQVIASRELEKSKDEISKQEKIDIDELKTDLKERIQHLKSKSKTKKEELQVTESARSEKRLI